MKRIITQVLSMVNGQWSIVILSTFLFALFTLTMASSTFAQSCIPPEVPVYDNNGNLIGCTISPCRDSDLDSLPIPISLFSQYPALKIDKPGFCTDPVIPGGASDYCDPSSSILLMEQYCVDSATENRCHQTLDFCPAGTTCSGGACVPSGGGSPTCSDSDGSAVPSPVQRSEFLSRLSGQIGTKGTCNAPNSGGIVFDSCISNNELNEMYCVANDPNNCYQTTGTCPSGQTCLNGRCSSPGGPGGPGPGGGSTGATGVGTITPPAGFKLPFISGDTNIFVAGLVRNGIGAMILIAFVVALIWLILAGFKFILANGEPKEVSAAWSQIRYSLIGLAIIMSAYAIIRIAETFFGVDIISGGLRLPRRSL